MLTLMKGDEVVKTLEEGANLALFFLTGRLLNRNPRDFSLVDFLRKSDVKSSTENICLHTI